MGVGAAVEGGEGGGPGEQAAVQRLLGQGVVGRVARPRHQVHRHRPSQLSQAHVNVPATGGGGEAGGQGATSATLLPRGGGEGVSASQPAMS